MTPDISVDEDVWTALKELAEPFVDTPNSVLRRLLDLENAEKPSPKRRIKRPKADDESRQRRRAPAGSLLPESAYEHPILGALVAAGGRAPAAEVISDVGRALTDELTPLDKEELPNGGLRWENRAQFTRLKLKERGLIVSGSPRGIWEISDAGRKAVQAVGGKGRG
jgi:hypothetical protein